ncbi:6-phospho-3-hexuloisomerase [Lactobacillus gasseri]|jgi:6-phospho-3-hexuloisomerase|uniref:3-hexulose-6-phosphate isomerase n=1 Tax=Lactobacillus gasseri TaxID=1596 RepID=A0ABY3BI17_LACGS|nr:6-phospho-3-hexuloisomerase [Lactobacillus gasseri]MCZ3932969.1 SIS domain-containing protein [Lactobacillus gasseri]MCZ3934602.1 SIS domain-containing protein [Lactobacillus gasseri]MCZ3936538.1 SIS domain-containing protein [Lactobacillus gasseri]MCZ3943841.1 SIS domain-containing protein [Lactobacillus gasseri]MCZ3949354.1 SIS domain-containing protein [Lactobacillus gasseri]
MIKEFKDITNEIVATTTSLSKADMNQIINMLFSAKQIFLSGEGRSGLMIAAFANRLTQLGLNSHVSSEITAPALSNGDILIFNSASGTSALLNSQAKVSQQLGVEILTFTVNNNSPLAQKSDVVVTINAQSKDDYNGSIQPMGSLFEQCSFLIFDSIILHILNQNHLSSKKMRQMHSNLE